MAGTSSVDFTRALFGIGAALWVAVAVLAWVRRGMRERWRRSLMPPDLARAPGRETVATVTLGRFADEVRVVRRLLEVPLARHVDAPVHLTPWGRRAGYEGYDAALVEVRHALWSLHAQARALPEADREELARRGLDLRPTLARLLAPGVLERGADPWDAGLVPQAPDMSRVGRALADGMRALGEIEHALCMPASSPYR
jgi:hypothetical protein